MQSLSQFRDAHPEYNDMSDDDLSVALHNKYYSDMPLDDFKNKLGVTQPTSTYSQIMQHAAKLFPMAGVAEAGTAMATGAIGKTASDLAGLGTVAGGLLGLTNADPGKVKSDVQNALTYQPRSDVGKDVMKVASLPGQALSAIGTPLAHGARAVSNAAGLPEPVGAGIEGGVEETVNQAPVLLGPHIGALGETLSKVKPADLSVAEAQTLSDASAMGIRVTPEYAGRSGGPVGNVAQTGESASILQKQLSKYNAEGPVPQVIKQEIGITPNRPLTQAAIDEVKGAYTQIYSAVKKAGDIVPDEQYIADVNRLGQRSAAQIESFGEASNTLVDELKSRYSPKYQDPNPPGMSALSNTPKVPVPFTAEAIVNEVQDLRYDFRKGKNSPDPAIRSRALASQQAADAMEGLLERHLQATNNPLAGALPQARMMLAKIHSVEDGFNEATGTVDVKSLAKDLDNGIPLTGGLRSLALAYKAFPKVLQDAAKVSVAGGSFFDKALQVGGVLHGRLGEIAMGAGRPVARALVNRQNFQNNLTNPQPNMFGRALQNPGLAGVVGATTEAGDNGLQQ